MGQAFDRDGNVLGEAYGDSKREVFDKLNTQFRDAHEIRIRSLADTVKSVEVREQFEREHGGVSAEMPRYKCHKEVHALKIRDVVDPAITGNESDGSRILVPEDGHYASFRVSRDYVQKHKPSAP